MMAVLKTTKILSALLCLVYGSGLLTFSHHELEHAHQHAEGCEPHQHDAQAAGSSENHEHPHESHDHSDADCVLCVLAKQTNSLLELASPVLLGVAPPVDQVAFYSEPEQSISILSSLTRRGPPCLLT
jgi:hypothetical protein